MSKPLSDRVRSRIGSTLISDYGSAETSCVAAAPLSAIDSICKAAGYVASGMVVEIVDDNDRPVPAGQEGIVRIRGDYAATGYINDVEASEEFSHGNRFYPGDLGSVTPESLLIISGRRTSVLNLGGEKIKLDNRRCDRLFQRGSRRCRYRSGESIRRRRGLGCNCSAPADQRRSIAATLSK